MPDAALICAVPGCGADLARMSTSGVCRAHNHARPWCRCVQCAGPPPIREAVVEEKPEETPERPRLPGVLYELPADGAPISEWVKPLSGSIRNVREPSSFSGAKPSPHKSGGGAKFIVNRVNGRRRAAEIQRHDETIRRMAADSQPTRAICESTGLAPYQVRASADRLGLVLQGRRRKANG